MAERVEVSWVDDIDGSTAEHTLTFALDGADYEIDVSARHAQQLRDLLGFYIARSRSVDPAGPRTQRERDRDRRRQRTANRALTEQIRGAAQRTRRHTETPPVAKHASDHRVEDDQEPETDLLPAAAAPGETGDQSQQSIQTRSPTSTSPVVPVPQFSSPSD